MPGAFVNRLSRREAAEVVAGMGQLTNRERIAETRRLMWSEQRWKEKYELQNSDEVLEAWEALGNAEAQRQGVIAVRGSDRMPGVDSREFDALESMLDRAGLRAVLRSLREMCDARADANNIGTTFGEVSDVEQWAEAANTLETLVLSQAVNVK
jgi:hypothetical protein